MSVRNVLFYGSEINFVNEILRQQGVSCFTTGDINKNVCADEIEVVVAPNSFEISAETIKSFKELKLIIVAGGGKDKIDTIYSEANDITVVTASSNTISTAEFTLFSLLYLSRAIYNKESFSSSATYGFDAATGVDLYGKTLGIVGLGRIGQLLCKMLSGFSMKILAYDPKAKESVFTDSNAEKSEFDNLLAQSDFISILCPSTPETKHMFSKETFSKMKPEVCLINTARGNIIDEEALIQALKENKIKACALDVFESEPLDKNSPLHGFDNCYLTPHIAGHTVDSRSRLYQNVTNDILDYFNNKENEGLFDLL